MHGQFDKNLDELKQTTLWQERSAAVQQLEKEPELDLGDDLFA